MDCEDELDGEVLSFFWNFSFLLCIFFSLGIDLNWCNCLGVFPEERRLILLL